MTKKEELKETYLQDVQLASSKSKFGYFNIPPPVFAGQETFQQKKIQKDQNGKLKTQQRNIFSGISASGIMKKSYFSYPEHKKGDLYFDPGKIDRLKQLKDKEIHKDKQSFKPASLNKTITTCSYEYIPQRQQIKNPKVYRNQNGKVKLENPNILSSPSSKIQHTSLTKLKYISDPYQNLKLMRRKQLFEDISKRGQNAFKPSSPVKNYFATNKEKFGQVQVSKKKQLQVVYNIQQHDSNFKPSGNHFNNGQFSYPEYIPVKISEEQSKKATKKDPEQKKDPFKLIKIQKISKPSPSISFSKMNLIRSLRC